MSDRKSDQQITFDLGEYRESLENFVLDSLKNFAVEHPDEVVQAVSLSATPWYGWVACCIETAEHFLNNYAEYLEVGQNTRIPSVHSGDFKYALYSQWKCMEWKEEYCDVGGEIRILDVEGRVIDVDSEYGAIEDFSRPIFDLLSEVMQNVIAVKPLPPLKRVNDFMLGVEIENSPLVNFWVPEAYSEEIVHIDGMMPQKVERDFLSPTAQQRLNNRKLRTIQFPKVSLGGLALSRKGSMVPGEEFGVACGDVVVPDDRELVLILDFDTAFGDIVKKLPPDSVNSIVFAENIDDEDLVGVKRLRGVHGLDFSETTIGDRGVRHLKGMTGLRFLSLRSTQVTDEGLQYLGSLTGLQKLSLEGIDISGEGLAALSGCKQLKYLNLAGTNLSDEHVSSLASLGSLRKLILQETPLSSEGLRFLGELPNLEVLDLSLTDASDEIAPCLALLTWMRRLYLNGTLITDEGLAHISELMHLEHLTLAGCDITDAGLVHLRPLEELRLVNLSSTQVSNTGLDLLGRFLPGCEIHDNIETTGSCSS